MAAQAAPVLPANRINTITSLLGGFFQKQDVYSVMFTLLSDLVALRNSVDTLNTLFLAHTHKVPSGALAAQSSGPDNTTAAGGAATAPTANAAPASTLTVV